jgi:hypothetical protein
MFRPIHLELQNKHHAHAYNHRTIIFPPPPAAYSTSPVSGVWTDLSVVRDSYISLVSNPRGCPPQTQAAPPVIMGQGQIQTQNQTQSGRATTSAKKPVPTGPQPPLVGREAAVLTSVPRSLNVNLRERDSTIEARIEMIHVSGGRISPQDEDRVSSLPSTRRPPSISSRPSRTNESSSTVATTWSRVYRSAKDGGY